ncbi:MAG: hypothetical protein K1W19_12175 [Lachnospiraceae bacterium]
MAYWFRYQATYLEMKYHLERVLSGKEEYYIKPIKHYDRNIGKSAALARLSVKYNILIAVPTQMWKKFIEYNIPRNIPKYFKKNKPEIIVMSNYLRDQKYKILLMEERLEGRQVEQVNNMCRGTVVGYRNYD